MSTLPMPIKLALLLLLPLLLAACEVTDPQARREALHLPPPGFQGNPALGVEAGGFCAIPANQQASYPTPNGGDAG